MMKLKYVKNIAVLLSVLSVTSVSAKEWTSVRIATEGAYEPWNLTLPGGKIGGFEPELIEDLCGRMKIECNLVTQNWDGMIAGLNAGKYDMIMDAISITPERQKVVSFSLPYASTSATFIVKDKSILGPVAEEATKLERDGENINSVVEPLLKALEGKTLGVQTGTVYIPFIEKYLSSISKREYTTAASAILDLKSGRIDVIFEDTTFANAFLAKNGNESLSLAGPLIGGNIWGEGEAFGFRKSDSELKEMFNTALKAALADGTVKRLSQKWFHTDLTP